MSHLINCAYFLKASYWMYLIPVFHCLPNLCKNEIQRRQFFPIIIESMLQLSVFWYTDINFSAFTPKSCHSN